VPGDEVALAGVGGQAELEATANRRFAPTLVRNGAGLAFAAAAVLYVVLYMHLLRNVGLAYDEWEWLLYRMSSYSTVSSFGNIVLPYNSQPIVGEILLYRLWAHTVGVAHHWVLDFVYVLMEVGVAWLVYSMARRRVGPWPAVGCAVLVLVMGRAWETVLFPASMTFVLPTLAACAAWATLDDRRPVLIWALVSVLLALAALSGGLGIAVGVGLCVEVALARRWGGLWLAACAAVPWIVWYIAENATTGVDIARNLGKTPVWGAKYLAAAAAAAVGLPADAGFAVIPVVIVGIWLWRSHARPSSPVWTPRAAGLLTTLLVAVIATGAARATNTPPATSRYMYFPAIVMILLACEWTAGLTLARRRVAVALGVATVLLAGILGVHQFRNGKVFFLGAADATAARMGAMRLVGGPPLVIEPQGLGYTPALLAEFTRRFGSRPIYTEKEIAAALPASRSAVDYVLASAEVRPGHSPHSCHAAPAGGDLPHTGTTVVIDSSRKHVAELVRFADVGSGVGFAVPPPRIVIRLRADHITRPWRLLAPGSVVQVCK
jgi:hypothetical protein